MGCCTSSPVLACDGDGSAAGATTAATAPAHQQQGKLGQALAVQPQPQSQLQLQSQQPNKSENQPDKALGAVDSPMFLMRRVRQVMQDIASLPLRGRPASACTLAARCLLQHLSTEDVDFVGVVAYTSQPGTCLLAGAAGLGAPLLLRQSIMTGPAWAAAQARGRAPAQPLRASIAGDGADGGAVSDLPQDWAALHSMVGLREFMAIPFAAADGSEVGVLQLGSMTSGALAHDWCARSVCGGARTCKGHMHRKRCSDSTGTTFHDTPTYCTCTSPHFCVLLPPTTALLWLPWVCLLLLLSESLDSSCP